MIFKRNYVAALIVFSVLFGASSGAHAQRVSCWNLNYDSAEALAEAKDPLGAFCFAFFNATSYADSRISSDERRHRRALAMKYRQRAIRLGANYFNSYTSGGQSFDGYIRDGDRLSGGAGGRSYGGGGNNCAFVRCVPGTNVPEPAARQMIYGR